MLTKLGKNLIYPLSLKMFNSISSYYFLTKRLQKKRFSSSFCLLLFRNYICFVNLCNFLTRSKDRFIKSNKPVQLFLFYVFNFFLILINAFNISFVILNEVKNLLMNEMLPVVSMTKEESGVGANLCVRPLSPGRHIGLPLPIDKSIYKK